MGTKANKSDAEGTGRNDHLLRTHDDAEEGQDGGRSSTAMTGDTDGKKVAGSPSRTSALRRALDYSAVALTAGTLFAGGKLISIGSVALNGMSTVAQYVTEQVSVPVGAIYGTGGWTTFYSTSLATLTGTSTSLAYSVAQPYFIEGLALMAAGILSFLGIWFYRKREGKDG